MAAYSGSFTGSFSGSFIGDGSGLTSLPSGIISASGQIEYYDLRNIPDTITGFQKNSILANNAFRENFTASLLTELNEIGVVSSSAQIDFSLISGAPSIIVSASTFSSPSQGTMRSVINGVVTDVDLGLQVSDNVKFAEITSSKLVISNDQTTDDLVLVQVSGSNTLRINNDGTFIMESQNQLPSGEVGAAAVSGSNFFIYL